MFMSNTCKVGNKKLVHDTEFGSLKQKLVHDTQSAQQAQSKKHDTYIVES